MRNLSGYVDVDAIVTAAVTESEVGAEKGSTNLRGGLVTDLLQLHVSLESASETRSANGIVLESEKETGIGLLGVVVRTAARAVQAVAAAVVVVVVVVDTAHPTATGHWPREWDSDIVFLEMRPLNNVGTDLHELTATYGPVNIVYPVRIPSYSHDATPL